MPIIALIIYMILGLTLDLWHPGWLVFLLVPAANVIFMPYKKRKLSKIAPFLAITIFILVGVFVPNGFHYSWLAFLLIPLINILDS
jgi:hypothetical protein